MEPKDLYKEVASKICKVPYDEVTEKQRDFARTVMFGMAYGAPAPRVTEALKEIEKEKKRNDN